jgi:hypothetical protein
MLLSSVTGAPVLSHAMKTYVVRVSGWLKLFSTPLGPVSYTRLRMALLPGSRQLGREADQSAAYNAELNLE